MLTKERASAVMDRLAKVYPDAKPELKYNNALVPLYFIVEFKGCKC